MDDNSYLQPQPAAPNKWFAAFLGFFFPAVAFLYLANLSLAILYFALTIVVVALDLFLSSYLGFPFFGSIFSLICCIQAFRLAKNVSYEGKRKWYARWWGALSIPTVFLVLVFLVRSFFYEPYHYPSSSMSPTLKVNDYLIISKWGYGNYGTYGINLFNSEPGSSSRKPKRGEIFVFYPPHDERAFVKRIIGLPGDHLKFENKQLYINGEEVRVQQVAGTEEYVEILGDNSYSIQYLGVFNPFREFETIVPDNMYFSMGDNRDNSADSRAWGFIPSENIVGKLVLVW